MKRALLLAWLLLALLWGLVSCVPKPAVIEPIAPKAAIVHEQTRTAAETSRRAVTATESVHAQAGSIAAEVAKAFAEVDMLRAADAQPDRFDSLVALMTDLSAHSQIHVVSSLEAGQRAIESERSAALAEISAAGLVPAAVATDRQTGALVTQNAKLAPKAAKWDAITGFAWAVGGFAVLGLLILAVSKLRPSIL